MLYIVMLGLDMEKITGVLSEDIVVSFNFYAETL